MQKLNLDNPFGKGDILFKKVTDTTMNDARLLAGDSPATGTLVTASEQTGGRGRVAGRKWLAEPGESLLFTMLVKKDELSFPVSMFPLFAGYCIAGFLEENYGIKANVKWPNDVLINGRKISGILCENSGDYILCGIGINCTQDNFPGIELSGSGAVSIYQICGVKYEITDILISLLRFMKKHWNNPGWKTELESSLFKKDENVVLCEGLPDSGTRLEGIIHGVGEDGELVIIEAETGLPRKVYSGEILCS